MSQELNDFWVGDFVFGVNTDQGVDYWPCTSVRLTMGLNALTSATIVVGCGRALWDVSDTMDHSAEALMRKVTDNIEAGESMIPCYLQENLQDGRSKVIFRGVITAASLVYKTGTSTNRAVRFECLDSACRLYAVPLGFNRYLAGSYIMNELAHHIVNPITQYGTYYYRQINVGELCNKLATKITGPASIIQRISYLVDGIVLMSGAEDKVNIDPETLDIVGVQDFIDCAYTVNQKLYNIKASQNATQATKDAVQNSNDSSGNSIDLDFNRVLAGHLVSMLQNSSVLEAIVSVITSEEYMLTLVPKFGGGMILQPSRAWSSKPSRILNFSQIRGINSTVNPLKHVADPDVFIVNYSNALPMDGGNLVAGMPAAVIGCYTRNKKFNELRAKAMNKQETNMGELFGNTMFKRRHYGAPRWMNDAFIGALKTPDQLEAERKQPNTEQLIADKKEKDPKDTRQVWANYNDTKGREIADQLAAALFAFIYGRSSTAEIELFPSLRFGWDGDIPLESLVGELVDIVPSEMDSEPQRWTDDLMSIRGMIESVSFSYDSGSSSSCSYSIKLSRVRPLKDNEEAIECPLYALTNETK